jgi:hypothetical protein
MRLKTLYSNVGVWCGPDHPSTLKTSRFEHHGTQLGWLSVSFLCTSIIVILIIKLESPPSATLFSILTSTSSLILNAWYVVSVRIGIYLPEIVGLYRSSIRIPSHNVLTWSVISQRFRDLRQHEGILWHRGRSVSGLALTLSTGHRWHI